MTPQQENFRNFKYLMPSAKRGSAFAYMSLIAGCLNMGGCLIVDRQAGSEEQNFPPSMVSAVNAQHPLGEIVRLDSDGEGLEEVFEIVVQDPNINQALDWRVFLDRIPSFPLNGLLDQGTLESVGSLNRPFQFEIGRDTLTAKTCSKVEMIVAGEFESTDNVPIVEGDIAFAVWWVTSVATLDLADCVQ